MLYAERYHDISCGHRVCGHDGKCAHLHGHNYRIHFVCESPELDRLGRVIDFSVIKERLCAWVEERWDHRFLLWEDDPLAGQLARIERTLVLLPFNPTAENMARYLVEVIGPDVLIGTAARLVRVTVEETAKCSATYAAS
ncbi:6-pyruvoyl trahydropterin synthase family protein [Cupriavidus taiwanensis]|uniref:6-pyruvoyl trahydropterin synthase family protein n=1 Tax=Cupriavidus taiwanensis TaxID=164546 RepID=UPI000E18A32F|nr:6-carboxytetrahydropterin synthase [Cupriavidus taiwanensis]SPA17235.1 6-pyruvoyl tetrahydropterin synthase/QueD family protein [Cupriavidus taiwanensis]